ncbi:MAG: RNA pseudouridine synthase [Bacteroidetes bacterium RIFOXYA12_FULL_35_11]|nr:MAG: RNA pseudouridine synthase [Bacteroidetes bacterium GWF2_35_48]OFY73790.1 MAG: RNA pseudouridine synthase [Bacteroidetes bacterium RIFOXYA12_FULL_35_11]OFY97610.1 MAG: RNA pseudouridine synthase [Bacteroidetes bacterium RIFOXYB2_FULL_35_7]HBX53488.1 RNA pseudouridine synthase [Bacteroidales bacterium]
MTDTPADEDIDELDESTGQNDLFEHYRFDVDKGQSLLRIDKFLTNRIEGISRNKVQNAAEAGCIRVNDVPVKSNYRVKPSDLITILLPHPKREIELIPQDISVEIIYEDDDLVIVNKTSEMVVHPGYGNYTGTLVNALAYHFRELPLFKTGELRPGLVHRIDKNTTGLIVVAKNELALSKLALQFFQKTTFRRYIALCWGDVKPDEGTITGHIGRSFSDRRVRTVFPEGDYGKHAVTHYKVLERFGYVSLVECRLETGRTHQIRVHFQHIGHPLFNDDTYGGNKILKGTTFTKYKQFIQNCFALLPRHALHARSLGFVHPTTGKYMEFQSELPDDMQKVIEKWRNYTVGRDAE